MYDKFIAKGAAFDSNTKEYNIILLRAGRDVIATQQGRDKSIIR